MLIRLPETWPQPVVAIIAMLVLAVLDLGGAFAAKEAVEHRSPMFAVIGAAFFLVLFWVYASSLQYAELGLVTLGWIVVLQVGVLLLDRWRYGSELSVGKWLAVGVILAAQAYLLVPSSPPPGPEVEVREVASASGSHDPGAAP